jgi:hypothetical protein
MLERAGFSDIAIRHEKRAGWIRHSARRAGSKWLQTRVGSEVAGWWGRLTGRGDGLLATAQKRDAI